MDTSELARVRARLLLALDLHETGKEIMRQNLRRRDPQAGPLEISRRLGEWLWKSSESSGGTPNDDQATSAPLSGEEPAL